jgi:protein O-GlcNAc transferase
MTAATNQSSAQTAGQTLYQALAAHSAGQWQQAAQLYRTVLNSEPRNAVAHHAMGEIALAVKQPAAGLMHLKIALEMNPDHGQYWLTYIQALTEAGHRDAAIAMFRQGVARGLSGAQVYAIATNLATDLALSLAASAHRSDPDQEELQALSRFFAQGKFADMESAARVLTMRFPQSGEAWKALGTAIMQVSAVDALTPLAQAAYLLPGDAMVHCNLGNAMHSAGQFVPAEAHFRRSLALDPALAEACAGLGNCLLAQRKFAEAETQFRRGIELRPDFAEAYSNLGIVLMAQGRYAEAERNYRRAVELKPDAAKAHNNLGNALKEQGRLADAERSFRAALVLDPGYVIAYSNLLLTLNYSAEHSPAFCLAEAGGFGAMLERNVRERYSSWLCAPVSPKLRIGFVSGDIANHPVGYFLEAMLRELDPDAVDLLAYVTSAKDDELTARIRPRFAGWRSLTGLSDAAAAQAIHADGIHVLIDLAGHTAHSRLPVFARRPAPVQVSWLGYFATTGMAAIDWFLADAISVPPEHETHFAEKIWRLPDTRLCFTPPSSDQPIAPLPALRNGHLTFGCFQNLTKVGDQVLSAWSEILASLPGARLRMQASQLAHDEVRTDFTARLRRHRIDPARVDLHGDVSREDYFAAHGEVDMILDTFPFPGGTTTCEALWMGVPTLTLAGDRLIARQGAGLIGAAGLHDWIAESRQQYIERAIVLANDVHSLQRLRADLRRRVLASPLFDAKKFARHFEQALQAMWQQRKPAA